jgi:2-polyprenyl-3-methyl-5-hydroxy-6-metoxy-1,4-benzoquinol methylase
VITVRTSKPVALDSPDHLHPFGTARDNSTHPRFNELLYQLIPAKHIWLLDLGCAGGGFVRSILDDGGFAMGIEGSDYSKARRRAEWATIPDHLFTADATEPFAIEMKNDESDCCMHDYDCDSRFNVVTAWEFFEHIAEDKLRTVVENIRRHVHYGSLLIGSISTSVERPRHQTIMSRDDWIGMFSRYQFAFCPDLVDHFGDDWLRGPNSPQPVPRSFPIVLRLVR